MTFVAEEDRGVPIWDIPVSVAGQWENASRDDDSSGRLAARQEA